MAEVIGFPVVGAKPKQQENVVGYNIREEQTIDTSAVENANNQTTTGMAGVIPGINAPKLFADTSVIGGGGTKIIEVSDYQSVSEWQPIVDMVLAGMPVAVHCKFTDYSNLQTFYFTPCVYIEGSVLVFGAFHPGIQWFRINCWLSGTTVSSMGKANDDRDISN